jgi:hypothetical protein
MPAPNVAIVPLDAGFAIINTALWGATRGGIRFANGKELRAIEFDGRRGRIVGHDRIVNWDPVITFDIVELNATVLARLEPGSTTVVAGGTTTITPKKAGVLFAAADYLTNFRMAYPLGNSGQYVQVRFPKALVVNYEGPTGTDKNEAVATVTIAAALDLAVGGSTTDDPPYVLEVITGLGLS